MSNDIHLVESSDPVTNPWHVAMVRGGEKAALFDSADEPHVMTFPHLILREVIAFQLVFIALALAAMLFDAPLEGIANPLETPNPAKAPWYFLGLQELLHYFPPIVAGVILPGLVVLALVVIPYAKVNLEAGPLWKKTSPRGGALIGAAVLALIAVFGAFSCWPVAVPTAAVGAALFFARGGEHSTGLRRFLWRVTLPEWIMTWFVVIAVLLTLIGTFFRGAGWSWIWPWQNAPRG